MIEKEIKDLAAAYNDATSVEEARELRSQLFTALLNLYGAPHYLVTFSSQEFIADGIAKISSIMAVRGNRYYVLECLPDTAGVTQRYDYMVGGEDDGSD